jgi:hypothetical protein
MGIGGFDSAHSSSNLLDMREHHSDNVHVAEPPACIGGCGAVPLAARHQGWGRDRPRRVCRLLPAGSRPLGLAITANLLLRRSLRDFTNARNAAAGTTFGYCRSTFG